MDDKGKPVHPIAADALKPVVDAHTSKGEDFRMSMVFPTSTHNYELRYWLAAGGIHPRFYGTTVDANARNGWIDADAKFLVSPPPQMPRLLGDGKIAGYCVGEPWNQKAVASGVGVPVVTDHEIWRFNPEKVFGLDAAFVEENPNTTVRIVRALLRAAKWLDDNANHPEAVDILARPEYVGAELEVLASSMTGTFEFKKGGQALGPRFQRVLSILRNLSLLFRRGVVPHPDATLGASRGRQSPTSGTSTLHEASTDTIFMPRQHGS